MIGMATKRKSGYSMHADLWGDIARRLDASQLWRVDARALGRIARVCRSACLGAAPVLSALRAREMPRRERAAMARGGGAFFRMRGTAVCVGDGDV